MMRGHIKTLFLSDDYKFFISEDENQRCFRFNDKNYLLRLWVKKLQIFRRCELKENLNRLSKLV